MMADTVTPGVYKHYKGDYYLVFFVGSMSNTEHEGEFVVGYLSLNPINEPVHFRTLYGESGFLTQLEDGTPRFTKVPDDDWANSGISHKTLQIVRDMITLGDRMINILNGTPEYGG